MKERNVNAFLKRSTDVVLALVGLLAFGWLIVLAACMARWETKKSGIFRQKRVGLKGKEFFILKIRTMHVSPLFVSTVTTKHDPRITRLGRIFRRMKIDELPQLINVLRGDMSFVGPRPDVPELAFKLRNLAPEILTVRPGITGPASLKYRNEEELLSGQREPEWVNEHVIFFDKIQLNRQYISERDWWGDWKYILQTLVGTGERCSALEFEQMIAARKKQEVRAA
jgi:lipopolysaccharide/colanic/teichoic acid biosynthesis glycosyltransferase